jgi:hypothetical protein
MSTFKERNSELDPHGRPGPSAVNVTSDHRTNSISGPFLVFCLRPTSVHRISAYLRQSKGGSRVGLRKTEELIREVNNVTSFLPAVALAKVFREWRQPL